MGNHSNSRVGRREVLALGVGAAVAATGATLFVGSADAASSREIARLKGKPRYNPNSREVQTFYRVNRYPAK